MKRVVIVLSAALLLAGCGRLVAPDGYLTEKKVDPPGTAGSFMVCHGYDCTYKTTVKVWPEEWEQVRAVLTPAAADAAEERQRIVEAVALMERFVGERIGTSADEGGFKMRIGGDPTQLDCIDETINTTVYFMMMKRDGLFRYHDVGRPAHRGFFLDGRWYHQTAVLREKKTGTDYAVDTWYADNGIPATPLLLSDWHAGYGDPAVSGAMSTPKKAARN